MSEGRDIYSGLTRIGRVERAGKAWVAFTLRDDELRPAGTYPTEKAATKAVTRKETADA